MSPPHEHRSLILGLHPTARGFGWAAFESPVSVFDAGLCTHKGSRKNAKCLDRFGQVVKRLKPETLVLESFDKQSTRRSARIRKLCLSIVSLAAERGLEVVVYKRGDVHSAFATVGARTRDEIAEAVVRSQPALKVHFPGRRKTSDSEDKRLSIFCAAALVITHFHQGANRLFDALKDAA